MCENSNHQHVLSIQLNAYEEPKKEQLFHTRCKVNDRVCYEIIDEKNCANLASEEIIHKLNFPTRNHSRPYDIQ